MFGIQNIAVSGEWKSTEQVEHQNHRHPNAFAFGKTVLLHHSCCSFLLRFFDSVSIVSVNSIIKKPLQDEITSFGMRVRSNHIRCVEEMDFIEHDLQSAH
jgi:hypothetical protein